MPVVDNKDLSPDEAILLGHCPECGQLLIPKTARAHASNHWFGKAPDDPSLSEEARRRYKPIINFAAALYNPPADPHATKSMPLASKIEPTVPTNNLAVFGFCELRGLIFGLPPGEDLYRGAPVSARMIAFLAIGGAFAILGPTWPSLKAKFPRRLSATFVRTASDFRWWLVALLFGLVVPGLIRNFNTVEIVPPPAHARARPTLTVAPNVDTRPHERVVDWRNFHPSWSIDLEKHLLDVTKPCILKVTSVREHLVLRNILIQIAKENSACSIADEMEDAVPSEKRDLDAMPIPSPGLSIDWNENTQARGESVAGWFDGIGFTVKRGDKLPSNAQPTEIWIDIGPGFLWQQP